MASGRRSAGERVLEGKHVIGLFLLMLLFSGVFFTLGYVMGRNQYSGQVSAENKATNVGEPRALAPTPKSEPSAKKTTGTPLNEADSQDYPVTNPEAPLKGGVWGNPTLNSKTEPLPLEPAPKPSPSLSPTPAKPPSPKTKVDVATTAGKNGRGAATTPLIPSGSYVLQVAALSKQDDALEVASSLQKKHFSSYVQPPQKDKYYRVQVGPFKDQKAADAAKKGLEGAGYKAFYVKH
jgi:cell division protein FtsN